MRDLASAENGAVLIIVVDHKHARVEEKDKRTADDSSGKVDVPIRSGYES